MNFAFMDISLHDFNRSELYDLGDEAYYDIKTTTRALLGTFESFLGETINLLLRHIDTAPASPALTSADVLRKVHSVPDRCVAWSNLSTLCEAAADS